MMTNAEALDFAKTVAKDQMEWLDEQMKRILPKVIHDKFVRGDMSRKEMSKWLHRNRIRIIFISNCPIVRIVQTKHGEDKILSEFRPRITVEGREVDLWKVMNSDNTNPADVWLDSDTKQT